LAVGSVSPTELFLPHPDFGVDSDAHLEIDVVDKVALLDSRRLPLTRKEYELLLLLVAQFWRLLRNNLNSRPGTDFRTRLQGLKKERSR
jgi:hypothetical protein